MRNHSETFNLQDKPRNRDDIAEAIKRLGELDREMSALENELNEKISQLTDRYMTSIKQSKSQYQRLYQDIAIWCEANKERLLTDDGKKSVNLITGEVKWRIRPPAVIVNDPQQALAALKRFGLNQFIRTRETINKEAILHQPEQIKGIAGIAILEGQEDVIVTPYEKALD
ncbi:host-nuclease inhibitor Gam family protein [Serratia odorifera]|uniref:host-nuclease inhibitor Gam family protein n=1 Tax=Serratia odorifera TaxID=618 RepID=UPI003D26FB50